MWSACVGEPGERGDEEARLVEGARSDWPRVDLPHRRRRSRGVRLRASHVQARRCDLRESLSELKEELSWGWCKEFCPAVALQILVLVKERERAIDKFRMASLTWIMNEEALCALCCVRWRMTLPHYFEIMKYFTLAKLKIKNKSN